jgi:hypothetical protein
MEEKICLLLKALMYCTMFFKVFSLLTLKTMYIITKTLAIHNVKGTYLLYNVLLIFSLQTLENHNWYRTLAIYNVPVPK